MKRAQAHQAAPSRDASNGPIRCRLSRCNRRCGSVVRVNTPTLCAHVGFEVIDGVAVLELRRPEKRNAVTWEMLEAILVHLESAARRADIRVLVIRGSGGAFSAGADLARVKDADGTPSASFEQLFIRALRAIADFPAPTVAGIEGACVGGGCALALACDVRLADTTAFFAIPAVRYGIVFEAGAITRMVELMGSSRAARMLFTARRIDALTAERAGLVDECAEDVNELVSGFVRDVLLGDADTIAATRALVRSAASDAAGGAR